MNFFVFFLYCFNVAKLLISHLFMCCYHIIFSIQNLNYGSIFISKQNTKYCIIYIYIFTFKLITRDWRRVLKQSFEKLSEHFIFRGIFRSVALNIQSISSKNIEQNINFMLDLNIVPRPHNNISVYKYI